MKTQVLEIPKYVKSQNRPSDHILKYFDTTPINQNQVSRQLLPFDYVESQMKTTDSDLPHYIHLIPSVLLCYKYRQNNSEFRIWSRIAIMPPASIGTNKYMITMTFKS